MQDRDAEVLPFVEAAMTELASYCSSQNTVACASFPSSGPVHIVNVSSQVVAGTMYKINLKIDATLYHFEVFSQPWTQTFNLTTAEIRSTAAEPAPLISQPLKLPDLTNKLAATTTQESAILHQLSGILVGGAPAFNPDGTRSSVFGGHYLSTSPTSMALRSGEWESTSSSEGSEIQSVLVPIAGISLLFLALVIMARRRRPHALLNRRTPQSDAIPSPMRSPSATAGV